MDKDTKIVFRALRPKTQQPAVVSPLPSRKGNGKHYTGQGKHGYYESLTTKEKEDMAYVITPQTTRKIMDGTTLDLSDPIDAADWKWIQLHPYIALDKKKAKSSRDIVYYVEDKKKDASDTVTRDKQITKAKNAMYKASREELDVVAKALGHPSPQGFSQDEVYAYILDIIAVTPETVIDAFNPENKSDVNVRSQLSDFLRYDVVVKVKGSYYYGGESGTFLGRSEQEVVAFLTDPEHSAIVQSMMAQSIEIRAQISEPDPVLKEE